MDRREFLLAGAVGTGMFAGCSSSPDGSDDGEHRSDDDNATESGADTTGRHEDAIEIDAVVPDDGIAGGDVLEAEVTVENGGEAERAVDLALGLDGTVAAEETVRVPAGEAVTVTLSTTITTLEPTSVTVNGEHVRDVFPTEPDLDVFHVAVDGADSNVGSEAAPLATLQEALDRATPGDTVYAHPGEYYQHPNTVRDGRAGEPITITGPADAVLHGGLGISHSHVRVTGMTFDGLQDPENPDDASSYASHNIGVHPPGWVEREYFSGYLEDVTIKPHAVGNTQGSSISFKYTNDVEVGEFEVVGPAGMKHLKDGEPGHNGEIIYIGIPFDKWLDPNERTKQRLDLDEFPVDESHGYHVHHIKQTAGHPHAELVDAKSGCHDVLIEYCTDVGGSGYYRLHDEKPPSDEASIHLGGTGVTVRWSVIEDGRGAGVIVGNSGGVDEMDDLVDFPDDRYPGTGNAVYGNRIVDNEGLAVAFHSIRHEADFDNGPDVQETICGNEIGGETMGEPERGCPEWVPDGDGIGHTGGDSPWA